MSKRLMIAVLLCALAAEMLFAPRPAAAQDQSQKYYTYVSEWAIPRAQWGDIDKQDAASAATMQKMVADGTLVDWGNLTIRVHQDDGLTHAEWFTATSRAALMKALEGQWTTAVNPAYSSATKHRDLLLHTIAHGGKASAVTTGYVRVAAYTAKPGAADSFEAHFMKSVKPFLDQEIANGTLLAYNFDDEDIHTIGPGSFFLGMVYPNAAAIDKFYADYAASEKEHPEEVQTMNTLTVPDLHRDLFGKVTAYQHK
ncbi:MAG TPA: hypothetical protein VJN21_13495 [Candidatus Acidoferrales bacterium]|nr:hypothetical protein [Candidatus Acidoferrales bacterium]